MVTYRQLTAADTDALREAAAAWRAVAARTTTTADDLSSLLTRMPWSGPAASNAAARLSRVRGALEAAAPALERIDQSLTDHADGVVAAQRAVLTATGDAGYGRVTVHADGSVGLDRSGERPDAGDLVMARRIADQIRGALGDAERYDSRTEARLRDAAPAARSRSGGWAGPLAVPPRGAPPAQVARWWRSLTAEQRSRLVRESPEIGRLDGVPADARDQANRLSLAREHRRLLDALARDPRDPATRRRLAAVETLLARLNGDGRPRAWLLDLDPTGDGRAVVALGDPDRAANVLTFVPGAGAALNSIGTSLSRTQRLADAAGARDPSTSVVLWLGYDAPDNAIVAAYPGYARQAESDLHRFQEGLRVTHDGARSHNVVLGHSYGSVVLGYTARDRGLDLDDAIVVGSPGIGVDEARDLHAPPGHVWAGLARHDAIKAAVRPTDLFTPHLDPLLRPLLGAPAGDLWYGPNPADPDFGARIFSTDPGRAADPIGTHDGYFDPGSRSLTAISEIAVGDYGDVR
ncbi:MAG TPA: alpha/beta hydrolase [Micromonosporaceae bacterium]